MTYGTDRGPSDPPAPMTLEDMVDRPHWGPIGTHALFQAALLFGTAALLAVPPGGALALVHLMGLLAAAIGTVAATSLAGKGPEAAERAVQVARRAVASLLLSAAALVALIAMHLGGGPG